MIFGKIADLVISHYKKFLAIWAIIFLLSGYLAVFASDVIVYEDTEMTPPDIESARADEIISGQFLDVPNSTAILVLKNPDIRSRQVADMVLDLETQINGNSTSSCKGNQKVRCFDGMVSIYSIYRSLIEATGSSLGGMLYDLEANVTGLTFLIYGLPYIFTTTHDSLSDGLDDGSFMVFGIPAGLLSNIDSVNSNSTFLYGIPSMYANTWEEVNSSALLLHGIPALYSRNWADVNTSATMLYGIPSMFSTAWNDSKIASFTIYGIPNLFKEEWDRTFENANLIYDGPGNYVQSWMALSNISNLTLRNDEAFDQSWDHVNSTIIDNGKRQLALEYQVEFHDHWNDSFNPNKTSYLDPLEVPPLSRAQIIVRDRAPSVFNFSEPTNGTQRSMHDVWEYFNITTYNDSSMLSNFTNGSTWPRALETMAGLDPSSEDMDIMSDYLGFFKQEWDLSFQTWTLVNSTWRTQYVIDRVAPGFISVVNLDDPERGSQMSKVYDLLDNDEWDDGHRLSQITDQIFNDTLGQMMPAWDISSEMEELLLDYYIQWFNGWNASFTNTSMDAFSNIQRAWWVVNETAWNYIDSLGPLYEGTTDVLGYVLTTVNMTTWDDVATINGRTRTYFDGNLDALAEDLGLEGAETEDARAYLSLFEPEWDASFQNASTRHLSASVRADTVLTKVAPEHIIDSSRGDDMKENLLFGVLYRFNGTNWHNASVIDGFTHSSFLSSLSTTASEMGVPPDRMDELERYIDSFHVQWNASFQLPPLRGYSARDRADYSVRASAPGYIDEAARDDPAMKGVMEGVLDRLGIGTWNDTMSIGSLAKDLLESTLDERAQDLGLDQKHEDAMRTYLDGFHSNWRSSYDIAGMEDEPDLQRAEWAISETMPDTVAGLPEDEANLLLELWHSLDLETWNDSLHKDMLANGMALSQTESVIDDILANMTGSSYSNQSMEDLAKGYLGSFYDIWNQSFINGSSEYMAPRTPSMDRGSTVVDIVAPRHFDFVVPRDEVSFLMSGIFDSFGFDNWSQFDMIHNFTIDYMAGSLSKSAGSALTIEDPFFQDLYELGREPAEDQIQALAENILRHGTLDDFPLRLSDDIVSQFINEKNDTMIIIMGFNKGTGGTFGPIIENGLDASGRICREIKRARGLEDLKVFVSGPAPMSIELEQTINEDIHTIDVVTALIVLILISLFFRSFIAPGIPLVSITAAIVATFGMIYVIGSYIIQIHYTVVTLTFTALMGAGIDYCIFIVARYREERLKGRSKEEAVRQSIVWAGESITTSGLAVMIGFGGLSILKFSMIQGTGVVLPIGIAIAILVALTFLPSLMMLFGDRIFWRPGFLGGDVLSKNPGPEGRAKKMAVSMKKAGSRRKGGSSGNDDDGGNVFYFSSAVNFATDHAKAVVIIALLVTIPTSVLAYTLEPSYDFFEGMPDTEAKMGLDAMAEGFGKSTGLETKVVLEVDHLLYQNGTYDIEVLDAIDELTQGISTNGAVRRVVSSTYSEGERIDKVDCWSVFGQEWKDTCLQQSLGRNKQAVLITIVLKDEAFKKSSIDSIHDIRDQIKRQKKNEPALSHAKILVGGATADMTDIEDLVESNIQGMRTIVIVGIFILLLLVLGSILIPLTALVSVGLGISWTLAMTMLFFSFVKGIPILWLMPIILFVVLMGLGMDYNIFIITRMREEVLKGYSDKVAIRRAVERTGGIITACGAIMAGAFGSMMLSKMGLLQQFGFALFFAISLDAFVVRIYLMPAIIVLLRRWNWWAPGRLQRIKRDDAGNLIVKGKIPPNRPNEPSIGSRSTDGARYPRASGRPLARRALNRSERMKKRSKRSKMKKRMRRRKRTG